MATAVKNNPDATVTSLFDRPAAISLVGVVYVVGSLGIVFKLLPYLFWDVLGHAFYGERGLNTESAVNNVFIAMLLVASATGLFILGLRLLGPRSTHGTRAGIFVGALGVLLILLITRWASLWFEHWSFYDRYYPPAVGVLLTLVVGLGLLVVGAYFFMQPSFEPFLQKFEDQGWFSATRFKSQQGRRVRLGTIVGILAIVVCGIWTMTYSSGTLRRLPQNWALNVPFTGKTVIDTAQFKTTDNKDIFTLNKLHAFFKSDANPLVVDRYALSEFNADLSKYVYVKEVNKATDLDREKNKGVFEKSEVAKASSTLEKEDGFDPKTDLPETEPMPTVGGAEVFATAQLLPSIMYTLPILLMALSLWMAWRIVNYPAFADFLIATEAELNKVSWTTRKKLVQDTIVVLVTVFMMAVYLFAMDMAWSHLLEWQPIRIIQIPKDGKDTNKSAESKKW